MSPESALVILVPEAEALVKPFREQHDPGAGVPAHITLLYPFKPPHQIGGVELDALHVRLAEFDAFRFGLTEARRFPAQVLYLAPEPEEPFRRMTQAIWRLYPETPPYGGKFAEVVPHLTVAHVEDPGLLDRIAHNFARASQDWLPIYAVANSVALLDNSTGRWEVRATFPLAG